MTRSGHEERKATMDMEKKAEGQGAQGKRDGYCLCTCSCCGHENPKGSRRCQACGNNLIVWDEILCPSCGAEILPEFSYCGYCGAKRPEGDCQ